MYLFSDNVEMWLHHSIYMFQYCSIETDESTSKLSLTANQWLKCKVQFRNRNNICIYNQKDKEAKIEFDKDILKLVTCLWHIQLMSTL